MAYRKSSPEWILFLKFLDKTGYKAEYIRILLKNKTAKEVTQLRTDADPLHYVRYEVEYIRRLLKNKTAKQVTQLRTDAIHRRYVRYALPDSITLQEFLYWNRINQRWYFYCCGKS